ncbi:MAG: vWA domain-containing protein [Cyanobacteriota bacterium]
MKKLNIKVLFILIVILISLCQFINAIEDNNNSNISVILGIDSSGSMKTTDPEYLRKESAKLFIDLLTTGDEIGIIEFSSKINLLSPLKQIKSTKDIIDVKKTLDKLQSGGDTRIDLASEEVLKEFKSSKAPNKVFVLLTDGALDVDGSPVSQKSRKALNKLLNVTLKQMKDENITVFPISLSDKSADLESQKLQNELMTKFAEETKGQYTVAQNATELHKSFVNIINQITDPPEIKPLVKNGYYEFKVDSSVKRINILIYKLPQFKGNITIESPTSHFNKSVKDIISWSKSTNNEIITLLNKPEVGLWKIISGDNIEKLQVIIFVDSDYKISSPEVNGTKQATKKLSVVSFFQKKDTAKAIYKKIPLPDKTKAFIFITQPDNNAFSIPLNKLNDNANYTEFIPKTGGIYKLFSYTTGNIERRSKEINLNILPAPLNEPEIILDHNVYAIGESVRITVIAKDRRITFPEDCLATNIKSEKNSKGSRFLKTKIKDNKIYSKIKLIDTLKPAQYKVVLGYYDINGEIQHKEEIIYVLGKIYLSNNLIDFGVPDKDGNAKASINIISDLDKTRMPVNIEISNIKLNSDIIKASDLRFKYTPEIFTDGAVTNEKLILSLPQKVYNKFKSGLKPKTIEGVLTFNLYNSQNELLSKNDLPFKVVSTGLFAANYFIIILIILFLIGAVIIKNILKTPGEKS